MELKKSMKFAIIRRNGLGDFISATVPVCKYIKDKYPNSELYMFLSEQNSVLAKYFFPKDFVYVFHSGNKYFETLKAAVIHRDISPDVGIAPSPSYNKLNGPFLKLLGAKEIYGIKEEVPSFADRFFTKLVNVSYEDHVGLQNIRLFEENINALPEKYYPRFDKSFIRDCVIELPAMRKVIVELSNRRKTSQLTNNKLASVLNSIGKQLDFSVIISLVEKDKQRALGLQKLLNMPTKIVLTKTIDDYVSLLNQADFFLFGDGGGAHIAGALGKPGVATYGRTSVYRWGVLSNKVKHIFDKDDVNNIDAELIKEKLFEILSQDSRKEYCEKCA